MATRGKKPKPTALKVLEGNPGKRPLNDREPVRQGHAQCKRGSCRKEGVEAARAHGSHGRADHQPIPRRLEHQTYAPGGRRPRNSSPGTAPSSDSGYVQLGAAGQHPSRTSRSCSRSAPFGRHLRPRAASSPGRFGGQGLGGPHGTAAQGEW